MIQYILSFFRPDLARTLNAFNRVVDQLEDVANHQADQAGKHRAKAAIAAQKAATADAQVAQAQAVQNRMKALVAPPEAAQ